MPPTSSRMTMNRAQPTRYRPGKAEEADLDSEEESSEEEDDDERPTKEPAPRATAFPSQKKLAVDLSKAGQQVSSNPQVQPNKQDEDGEGFVTASESSEEEGEGSSEGSQGESSEEEESSSDEEPKKPMLAPKFISKAKRGQQAASKNGPTAEDKAAEEERQRQEKADELLQAHIDRDAAARAAGKKYWDDDDIAPEDEVDDTDGLDPEAEKAAWRLRELKRVRRERTAIEEKEKEREEIERRRNMTAEEREAEDREIVAQQKEDREGKGKMGYMQKYFHKGAFFNDAAQDAEVQQALNRDLAGAKFTDDGGDKSVLPKYMRIRDLSKLGKKGRTKYKDLKNEDTGRWGSDVGRKKREFDGLDDRFRPDDQGGGGRERTGANDAPLGERRRMEDDDDRERGEKRARYH